jgi:hypothetical protein
MTSGTADAPRAAEPSKRKPGRPRGELQAVIARAAAAAPGTVRELAERTRLDYAAALQTVADVVRCVDLMELAQVAIPGN